MQRKHILPEVRTALRSVKLIKPILSFVDEPLLRLKTSKELPPHLEYAFLEGDNKLPVIIAKELDVEEKSALVKVLKSHKRALAWKLSDIQGDREPRCESSVLIGNPYENVNDRKEINESFPLETLNMVTFRGDSRTPWFADFANYHAGGFIVKGIRDEMPPKTPSKFVKSLTIWGIDFMGRSRSSRVWGTSIFYSWLAVDYLSKWVEGESTPHHDAFE
ncbi:hypothetical protein Tco_1218245 [Tanacetum coccineum]